MSSPNTAGFTGLALSGEDLFTGVHNGNTIFDEVSFDSLKSVVSSEITVEGAALGDFVLVSSNIKTNGLFAQGQVVDKDKVIIELFNATAKSIDLDESTWKIKVLKG